MTSKLLILLGLLGVSCGIQLATTNADCWENYASGSAFVQPPTVRSLHGYLDTQLHYTWLVNSDQSLIDQGDAGWYCYLLEDTAERSPTLRAYPGDTMLVTLNNELTPDPTPLMTLPTNNYCTEKFAYLSSTNMHFHGIHSPPTCHDDNVVMSVVNAGQAFTYAVEIPRTQPPGLYWYHPHVHHLADNQVMGGATGAIVIEGIEKIVPSLAGLPEHILVLRDYFRGYNTVTGYDDLTVYPLAFRDLSVNFIPVPYPLYPTVPMTVLPGTRQFFRVLNSASFTELNLTVTYDGVPQKFTLIALDGVTIGDGMTVSTLDVSSVFMATGGRVEFVLTTPAVGVTAVISTQAVNMEDGKTNAPSRPIISLIGSDSATVENYIPEIGAEEDDFVVSVKGRDVPAALLNATARIPGNLLTNTHVNRTRHLIFTQDLTDDYDPSFWVTEAGHEKHLFNMSGPVAITVTQGTTEDWIIENRAEENHDFHIHQMHFVLLQRNGLDVTAAEQQYQDVVNIPHCHGVGLDFPGQADNASHICPSVKVRVDFTGDVVGKFVYHCHVLYHEDHGMMAVIQVVPCPDGAAYCGNGVDEAGDDYPAKHTTFLIAIGVLAGLVGLLLIGILAFTAMYFAVKNQPYSASAPAAQPVKSVELTPNPSATATTTQGGVVRVDENEEKLSEV